MTTSIVRKYLACFMLTLALAATEPSAQTSQNPQSPTRFDILRGEYGPYRANNDLLFYHLDVRVDPEKKLLSGKTTIRFRMLKDDSRIQLDLHENLKVDEIVLVSPKSNVRWRRCSGIYEGFRRGVCRFSGNVEGGAHLHDRFLLFGKSVGDRQVRRHRF